MKKIGLVRHHRVMEGYPTRGFITAQDIEEWLERYDRSAIDIKPIELDETEWAACFSSDLSRAMQTAESVYEKEIVVTELLRELPFPVLKTKLRLPFFGWVVLARLAAPFNPRIKEQIKEANTRIEILLNQLKMLPHDNILLIGHGGMMLLMRSALKRRGFSGPRFGHPRNGILYVFEKRADR
ncbi:histidine phosphatase family protein [Exiguobacterium flavidum]|uniref:histidine phosphatase family protein n=1 Tax=Exiguobacterium flavidum TaxID=2184695 RepID=UPI000DF8015B|nr:histidine phosphatase family protein [Exiguobacterium flavidum]